MQVFAFGESVADFEAAVVGDTYYIAGESLVYNILLLRHKGCRSCKAHSLARAYVLVRRVALEAARADLYECDTATVVRVHISVDFEHETRERRLGRLYCALDGVDRTGRRCYLHKAVQKLFHAEGIECRPEEYGSDLAGEIRLNIEVGIYPLNQLEVFAQALGVFLAYSLVDARVVDVVYLHALGCLLLVGREQVESMLIYIIHAFEFRTYINRPRKRAHSNLQLGFKLVEYLERVATLAVELVYEDYNRSVAHAAYLHEFARLSLDALCHVDHYNYGVDRRKGAVGIFGKVLVTRGVKDIDFIIAVVEAHYRCGYRNTALLFDFHPVAGGGFLYLVGLYGAGDMDSTAEKEQLLGECRLTCVGMRYNGESTSPLYFFANAGHVITLRYSCRRAAMCASEVW